MSFKCVTLAKNIQKSIFYSTNWENYVENALLFVLGVLYLLALCECFFCILSFIIICLLLSCKEKSIM